MSRALRRRGTALNRVAPARTLVEARYEHPLADELGAEGICHLNVHPPAGPQQLRGRNPRKPIVKQYRRVWSHVRRAARDAAAPGTSSSSPPTASCQPASAARGLRPCRPAAWV